MGRDPLRFFSDNSCSIFSYSGIEEIKIMAGQSDLNIFEMVTGPFQTLRCIKRFSNCHRINDESVAEHSYQVAVYTLLMCMDLQERGYTVQLSRAVSQALVHDLEESESGDIIRTFKHFSPELVEGIDKTSAKFIKEIVRQVFPIDPVWLFNLWANAKRKDLEGSIIELADYLSALGYIHSEVMMGNTAIARCNRENFIDGFKRFSEDDTQRFILLDPYIKGAGKILDYVTSFR